MTPTERFLWWIKERHNIYLKRQRGEPKPWTKDKVLQQFFFTNPYRENDKTTVWFRENVREPLRGDLDVLFATICFRWFNLIATGEILLRRNLLQRWRPALAKAVLRNRSPVFTGAFMIPAVPGTKKVDHVCNCLAPIWKHRKTLVLAIEAGTMQECHEQLLQFPYLGNFMAYEIVCDLRYTYLLENATDKMSWCNPGPGCARGLWRLQGETLDGVAAAHGCSPPKDWLLRMQKLLALANKKLKGMPPLEMREVEHSLCEFDKYERARLGTGRMKRKYQGV